MDEEEGKVFFFPAGGEGNKKRKKQKTFRALLQEHASEYHGTEMDKREFIEKNIMSKFPKGAYMVETNGDKRLLNNDDTFKIISQKLRDQYNKTIKPKKQKQEKEEAAASLPAEEEGDNKTKEQFFAFIESVKQENETLKKLTEEQKEKIEYLEKLLSEKEQQLQELLGEEYDETQRKPAARDGETQKKRAREADEKDEELTSEKDGETQKKRAREADEKDEGEKGTDDVKKGEDPFGNNDNDSTDSSAKEVSMASV